jgi:Flp pilus assembly secretin CpaC
MLNNAFSRRRALLAAALLLAAPPALAEAPIHLGKDRLKPLDLIGEIGTVLVANPAIADVVPIDPRRLAVIGKHPGSTSLVVLSKAGERLLDTTVVVGQDRRWTVTIHRGGAESQLTCAPVCAAATDPATAPAAPAGGPSPPATPAAPTR